MIRTNSAFKKKSTSAKRIFEETIKTFECSFWNFRVSEISNRSFMIYEYPGNNLK